MTPRLSLILIGCLVSWSCGVDSRQGRLSPTAASPVVNPAPPAPRTLPQVESTAIEIGDVVSRTIVTAPPCLGLPDWPCQYFRFIAPRNGDLEIALSYSSATQRGQGVDVSLISEIGETIAQHFNWSQGYSETQLTARAAKGQEYLIVLWYTFPQLEYEMRTTLSE